MPTSIFLFSRFRPALVLWLAPLVVAATFAAGAPPVEPREANEATAILAAADYRGGLIIHVGCNDGRLTAALQRGDESVVHGLDRDAARVAEARKHIRELGLYGAVSVDMFDGKHLPYAENLVNLVVSEDLDSVAMDEVMRVLAPGGVAYVKSGDEWTKTAKPRPRDIDDWTHFLYDASGNAVSHDRRVGPPQRLQWDGGPRWSRSHETDMSVTAAVTSGGRVFHTVDDGPIGIHETPRASRQLPDKCSLVARDAFNGIVLWKRPLPDWGSAAWDNQRWKWGKGDQLWSAPLTLPRRLVADGDRIYTTLGFRAGVSELDAATGKTLRELPETKAAEEIVVSEKILVARVRDVQPDSAGGESLVAVDIGSGSVLWRQPVAAVADLTLAVAEGRVCFHDTRRIVALDLRTGRQLWQTENPPPSKRGITAGTLVMAKDVVLFAAASGAEARAAADGKQLWSTKTNTSFRGMPDVFVIGNTAWLGTLGTTGLDLLTGNVARQIDPGNLFTAGHHVRCHRGKATENYLLWSKRGVEFVDLQSDGHMRHDWVRGTCRYGIIPANGLLYAPPHPCFCYPGVKLAGFNALVAGEPRAESGEPEESEERLECGPAYAEIGGRKSEIGIGDDTPQSLLRAPPFRFPISDLRLQTIGLPTGTTTLVADVRRRSLGRS